ncbi:MAG: IS200/IS605 family transposase [Phycisphaerae bacterium]
MPRNVYSEINLHLTWHTKQDAPVLVDTVENRTHRYLRHRALQTPGVIVHEVGGTEDHVHLAVSIPPTVVIGNWIGELKGASSHHINHVICNRKVLGWQDGYGVVSFGTKDLAWVASYVRNQKKHHAEGQTFDRLERTHRPEDASSGSDRWNEPRADEQNDEAR